MKRLAFLFVVPFIVGFGHDKVRKCENLQNAINQSEKNYKQKISFTKYNRQYSKNNFLKKNSKNILIINTISFINLVFIIYCYFKKINLIFC